MTKIIIKTAKAEDPIYKERITISSSLGASMMRARARYQKRMHEAQKDKPSKK